MSYYKLMSGADCYCCGSKADCERAMEMHKSSLNGSKPTKASQMEFKIVEVEGKYPFDPPIHINLGYKPNVVLGPFR